jgi:hypothetical protein
MRPVHPPPVLRTARMGHPRSTNLGMVGSAHPMQLRKNGEPEAMNDLPRFFERGIR